MFTSVIICTRNRAEDLRKALQSLFDAGNLGSPDWEMLVVETSSDHTSEVCEDYKRRFPKHFRYLTERVIGKSQALNTGIAAARGDVLAFADDDVLFDSAYIRSIRAVFDSHSADAAQGRVLLDCEGGWPAWLDRDHLAVMADLQDWGQDVADYNGTLCGTNMIVRSKVFEKSGGFATELGPGGLGMWEDTEVSLRMRRSGCRMIYAPQILVRHQWPKDRLTKSFLRSRFFGQGRAEAYYVNLPVPLWRFGAYVVKDTVSKELTALWHRSAGRPGMALRTQCEARSHAGFLWQHLQFKRGVPRTLTTERTSVGSPRIEAQATP